MADYNPFAGGFEIKIPVSVNIKAATDSLRAYRAEVEAAFRTSPATYKAMWGSGGGAKVSSTPSEPMFTEEFVKEELFGPDWRAKESRGWRSIDEGLNKTKFSANEVKEELFGPHWRFKESGGWGWYGDHGKNVPSGNASPGGNPSGNVFSRGLGAVQSFVGAINTSVQKFTGGFANLRQGGNLAPNIPGFRTLTTGNTANTSYFGAALGGAYNNINLVGQLNRAAQAASAAGNAGGAMAAKAGALLALAGAIYKGAELAVKVGAMGTAAILGSGAKAATSNPGQMFNEMAATFDHINNIGASISNAAKMTEKFDDAVAAVTGKLPDTHFYVPQFYSIAAMQADFSSLLKRNLATTKAGAYGRSDAADVMTDLLANALSGL